MLKSLRMVVATPFHRPTSFDLSFLLISSSSSSLPHLSFTPFLPCRHHHHHHHYLSAGVSGGARLLCSSTEKSKRWLAMADSPILHSAKAVASSSSSSPTSTNLLQGRADEQGTASYEQRFATVAGSGHFRKLATYNDRAGDLTVASVGLGTYLGPETNIADKEYEESIYKALSMGINVLDAAINYRSMRSERAIGRAILSAVSSGIVQRNEVVVCTKGGYFTFDVDRPSNPRKWIEDVYIGPNIFSWSDFVAGCHCMSPSYMLDQLEKSRKNLGLDTMDIYYVHNPETQLSEISREEFNMRIKKVFSVLEDAVSANKITMYGVATWNGFRVPPKSKTHISLEDLVNAARDIAGEGHHFRVVQAPFNLSLQEAVTSPTQVVNGRSMSLVEAAKELGVAVVASASLMQANLVKGLPADLCRFFAEGGQVPTNAQCALQFVCTTPGITTALAGMRQVDHVQENAKVVSLSAVHKS